jgi:penicillin-binding protein 1C
LQPCPISLAPDITYLPKPQFLDRYGTPLSVTFQNPWNVHDVRPLHDIPALLQQAFITAEDQRFYQHRGADWHARAQALWQNLTARRVVRGASTITEQVVRLLSPRPRTLWARWLEGWEAQRLERCFAKAAILEFYLNQVPYARQRRGVVQAARVYFNRDLDTLSQTEMLALAVLVRAPGRLDLAHGTTALLTPLARLAAQLYTTDQLSAQEYEQILTAQFSLMPPQLPVHASHFVRYVQHLEAPSVLLHQGKIWTTLDATLQRQAQALLESRLRDLHSRQVTDAALLVVDHHRNEILSWVSAGGSQINAVLTPRQPGSTLKPFLYALALERGWTAATLIEDTPLAQPIGAGLHTFRNYSGRHYGPVRLREALGNSLNIPAVRTIDFVGQTAFLDRLHHLGFDSLTQPAEYYGHGLALGNGEVTLFELVRAYATLARHGVWQPLRATMHDVTPRASMPPVYSPEVSTLIAHILADPTARRLEFGGGSLLHFPVETAVKTGTSTDYRDAWAVGFSSRYTVGVWMGNLRQQPMRDVTGSIGPALILRALFADLHRHTDTPPLFLSPRLTPVMICRTTGERATPECPGVQEWFISPHLPGPAAAAPPPIPGSEGSLRLSQPTPGLHLAMDPRIPDALEAFAFVLPPGTAAVRIHWLVDGSLVGTTGQGERQFLWPLARGTHTVQAHVWPELQKEPLVTPAVEFIVK